jgi:hypothetical protein
MNSLQRRLLLLLLAALGLLALTSCRTTPTDQAVPWSRPAEWEGKLPGVGGM